MNDTLNLRRLLSCPRFAMQLWHPRRTTCSPMPNGDAVTKRLSFEEALTVSSDLRLLHMQRLLLCEVIQIGGGAEDAPEVFVRLSFSSAFGIVLTASTVLGNALAPGPCIL